MRHTTSSTRIVQLSAPGLATLVILGSLILSARSSGADPADPQRLRIERSPLTGLAVFVAVDGRTPIAITPAPGKAQADAHDFLRQHGRLFGVTDMAQQLTPAAVKPDAMNFRHTSFEQVHKGVPVFSGVIRVHEDAAGRVLSANGDFYPIPGQLRTVPTIDADTAAAKAKDVLKIGNPAVEFARLVIVDPGWYGDARIGAHLAFHLILTDPAVGLREAFFIDAHDGRVLDRWNMVHTARLRRIYNGNGGGSLPGSLARSEGDAPVASPADVNRGYDYLGDTYDYFFRAFGRDAINGTGGAMIATVNSNYPPCPNALWTGSQMVFCTGTVTDDITAHELSHGVTQYTADLIYQDQPGQLNEAYSDIFGEMIDLFNGDAAFAGPPAGPPNWPTHTTGPGTDTPNGLRTACSPRPSYSNGVRWLVGENATSFGGAIRDMWNPPCLGDPDRANSPLQTCNPDDNGGVHVGSGVPNHAFAMMVDGKTFNGYTVTGIGPIKTGAVWYRALAFYLTPASDFRDAYAALNQAAADLIGTTPNDPRTGAPSASMFTADDAVEVDDALRATEMDTAGACGFICDSTGFPPANDACPAATVAADGLNAFTTVDSTTDGSVSIPAAQCQSTVNVPFSNDVWFQYVATCNGGLEVSQCEFGRAGLYDGTVAVYGNNSAVCDCPGNSNATLLGCGDDSCGIGGGPATVTVGATAGHCYLIRVAAFTGSYPGDVGCGSVEIQCNSCNPASPPEEDPDDPDVGFGSKQRWLSFRGGDPGRVQAVRVKFVSLPAPFHVLNGQSRWVGLPTTITESAGQIQPADAPLAPTFRASPLECAPVFTDWAAYGVIHIHDRAIVPGGDYEIQILDETCSPTDEADFSIALVTRTSRWGDVVRNCTTTPCLSPDGSADIATDVVSVLDKFGNRPGAPGKARADNEPGDIDFRVNISDVTRMVDGFRSLPYPFSTLPDPCP